MPDCAPQFQETTVNGPRTRLWKIGAPDCPELRTHRIARLGWDDAGPLYSRVRLAPEGSFFLACVEGEGRVLLDGRWLRVAAGEVCMAPPRVLNAFRAATDRRFVFAWVRYVEPAGVRPMVGAASPVRNALGGADFARVIAGLRAEWEGARSLRMVHHWVSLVQEFASRFASPWQADDRLWKLWEKVGGELASPWSLDLLAQRAHLSAEHLRRLCLKTLGRSPMHHVTYMRMQRAQHLLENTGDKLEVIAPQVGYESGLVFSRAFKRWVGLNPTEYRSRR